MPDGTYEFGWRKFRLEVPEPWEPGYFGGDDVTGYVRLDDLYRPRLELRWSRAYRDDACDVAFERYLKDLSRAARKKKREAPLHREPKEIALVPAWPEGMRGRIVRWSADIDCVAAVIACERCNRLSAIQVLFPAGQMQTSLAREALRSFRDHTDDPDAPAWWSVYRMRLHVPSRWRLTRHRFGAGYAEMRFGGPGGLLADVRRWGPAEVILKKRNLLEWYLAQLPRGVKVSKEQVKHADVRGDTVLTAAREPKGVLAALRRRAAGKRARQAMALQSVGWHCPHTNRLWIVDVYARSPDEARAADWQVLCHDEAQGEPEDVEVA